MRKIWAVIRREFLERVRTKQFVIGTLLGPILMGALVFVPVLLSRGSNLKRIAVLDAGSGTLGTRIAETLRQSRRGDADSGAFRYEVEYVPAAGRLEALRDSLVALTDRRDLEPRLHGVLIVTDEVLANDTIRYLGGNVSSPSDMGTLQRTVRQAVMTEKLARSGIDPVVLGRTIRPVELVTTKVTQGRLTGESGEASFALAYAMSLILYMALLIYGMQVMTSTVEEKTNRINEILVSSLRPWELMLGKVVGVGSVGLFQLGIYGAAAWLLGSNRVWLAQRFGASAETAAALPIPAIPLGLILVFLAFFVLGFFFYAAAYAAVGSTCNTVQETQQASMPVTLLVVAGLMVMFGLLDDPNGRLGQVLTYVPPLAPMVTPVRHSLSPLPLSELLMSMAATAVGVVAMAWLAGRIYRVGILMYGKRATFREMARWVRAS